MKFSTRRAIKIVAKTNGRCGYCGRELDLDAKFDQHSRRSIYPTIDHMKPIFQGGEDDEKNLLPCCAQCNSKKHKKNVEEFRMYILKEIGAVFTPAQISYLKRCGIKLPELPKVVFYFEIMGKQEVKVD